MLVELALELDSLRLLLDTATSYPIRIGRVFFLILTKYNKLIIILASLLLEKLPYTSLKFSILTGGEGYRRSSTPYNRFLAKKLVRYRLKADYIITLPRE